MSKTVIARRRSDGAIVEMLEDGSERTFPSLPMRDMTDEEIHAAALADPDAQPRTLEELRTARRIPRVKTLRRAIGMTQREFALHYNIDLNKLLAWEAGHTEPNEKENAQLDQIARKNHVM